MQEVSYPSRRLGRGVGQAHLTKDLLQSGVEPK